jgi:hypothetical protein
MRIAVALFVAAAAFAWLAAHGRLQLNPGGTTPPAIVLHQDSAPGPSSTARRERFAVPRKVERSPLRAFAAHEKQAARP